MILDASPVGTFLPMFLIIGGVVLVVGIVIAIAVICSHKK